MYADGGGRALAEAEAEAARLRHELASAEHERREWAAQRDKFAKHQAQSDSLLVRPNALCRHRTSLRKRARRGRGWQERLLHEVESRERRPEAEPGLKPVDRSALAAHNSSIESEHSERVSPRASAAAQRDSLGIAAPAGVACMALGRRWCGRAQAA